jgi:hypothetical protein
VSANLLKRMTLEQYMARGLAQVFFDPKRQGVRLPKSLKDSELYWLDLSWKQGTQIEINDTGIITTLFFDDAPFEVTVPWDAVLGMTSVSDGEHKEW